MNGKLALLAAALIGASACAAGRDAPVAVGADQVSGVPDTAPTETLRVNGEKMDLYVFERDGEYVTKVCFRYQQTGSRIWRNSCNPAPVNNVVTDNYRGFMFRDLGRHQRLREDAERVARVAHGVFNGRVEITDLEATIDEIVKKSEVNIPEAERRPGAYGRQGR